MSEKLDKILAEETIDLVIGGVNYPTDLHVIIEGRSVYLRDIILEVDRGNNDQLYDELDKILELFGTNKKYIAPEIACLLGKPGASKRGESDGYLGYLSASGGFLTPRIISRHMNYNKDKNPKLISYLESSDDGREYRFSNAIELMKMVAHSSIIKGEVNKNLTFTRYSPTNIKD